MWKSWKKQVSEGLQEGSFDGLILQLRALEARIEALETVTLHPAAEARLDAMETRIENLMGDWANAKQALTRLYGRITKMYALDNPQNGELPSVPQTADDVFTMARAKGILR